MLAGCVGVPHEFHPLEPLAPQAFTHQLFDELLRASVFDGRVDYPAIQTDGRFEVYLSQLTRVDPTGLPTYRDQLAFWINAYNAFAVKGIIDGYAPDTLAGRYRYFLGRDYRVGGERITLYDLERNLLIPDFREPRVHFAIVCASRSCPKLKAEAYQPGRLDEQLEESARAFINDPTRNRFDRENRVASLSMIFKWFEEDFAAQGGSVLGYVARYVTDQDLAHDLAASPYTVEFLQYDWRLNGPYPKEVTRARTP
nr:DUF547 domain-containing protein [Nitrospirota bacterium]